MMGIALVFLGGVVGGVLRYLAATWWPAREDRWLSPGLLVVNLVGSLALGLVTGWATASGLLLLGTGLCGSLTTYSTFAIEALRIWRDDHRFAAVRQAAIMTLSGLGAAGMGLWLGGL